MLSSFVVVTTTYPSALSLWKTFYHEEQIWFEEFVCNRYQVVLDSFGNENSEEMILLEEFVYALQVMQ